MKRRNLSPQGEGPGERSPPSASGSTSGSAVESQSIPEAVQEPISSSASSESTVPPEGQEGRRRIRRWHQRGFTGCLTCRRRHVRCDGGTPTCRTCVRLGLECDGAEGRIKFKTFDPSVTSPGDSSASSAAATPVSVDGPGPSPSASLPVKPSKDKPKSDDTEKDDTRRYDSHAMTTIPERPALHYPQSSAQNSYSINYNDSQYFSHFVNRLSVLLFINDTPNNINPYRIYLPDMCRSSSSLASIMQALGALHLVTLTNEQQQRMAHFLYAVSKYDEVVRAFRTKTESGQQLQSTDLAVCLLLCLFEVCHPFPSSQSSTGRHCC